MADKLTNILFLLNNFNKFVFGAFSSDWGIIRYSGQVVINQSPGKPG